MKKNWWSNGSTRTLCKALGYFHAFYQILLSYFKVNFAKTTLQPKYTQFLRPNIYFNEFLKTSVGSNI